MSYHLQKLRNGVQLRLLRSRSIRLKIQEEIIERTEKLYLHYRVPHLHIISAGDDPTSKWFIDAKTKVAEKLGIAVTNRHFGNNALQSDIIKSIYAANMDIAINGILLSLPLPPSFDKASKKKLQDTIDPYKDVDCVTWKSRGKMFANMDVVLPATTQSCISLAEYDGDISEKNVVFIGSGNVGTPLYTALMNKYPSFKSVSICNEYTENIEDITRRADLIFSAVGKPNLITGDMISSNTTIIDAGMSKVGDDYVGDVDIESLNDVDCTVTPTPGGVGTLTTTMIMRNLMSVQSTVDLMKYHLDTHQLGIVGRSNGF